MKIIQFKHNAILGIVKFYRKLPVKFLKKLFTELYNWYVLQNREKTVIYSTDGITYELHLSELIDSAIFYQGSFEPQTSSLIDSICSKGMTVLDIGANIGCHTLRFAKNVGPQGRVIAFEPTSWAFKKLKRNVSLNHFNNISLEKLALSNKNEVDTCCLSSSWPIYPDPDMKLHPVHNGLIGEPEEVEFIKLDEYVSRKDISKIDLVKIDVDGYEYRVLEGGIETIRNNTPSMIIEMSERTHKAVGSDIYEMLSMLTKLGYHFLSIPEMKEIKFEQLVNLLQAGQEPNVLVKIHV